MFMSVTFQSYNSFPFVDVFIMHYECLLYNLPVTPFRALIEIVIVSNKEIELNLSLNNTDDFKL